MRVVLLGPDSSQPMVLEGVAAAIWRVVQDQGSCADVVQAVTEEFEVTAAVAHADVSAFLLALGEHGLVEIVSARDGS